MCEYFFLFQVKSYTQIEINLSNNRMRASRDSVGL